ncbi:MAG: NUDIX domain-containing protein [Candidatus Altiarchaeales archaeon]|nr:NUDIX domain-containing protein [Candidatus Altiarchaeales archaeon]MBD3415613.1 NUDIX domain-containing protein [Candidatus Altiarchaeales archaeon]
MTEFFDIVDDDDNVVGRAGRQEAHDNHLLHRSVQFFIFDPENRILVNRRSQGKEFFAGMWSIVLGGHVPSGESYYDAVVREAEEEAGVTSEPFKIGHFKKRLPEESENVMVYGFRTAEKPDLLAEEIEYGEFMTLEEAKKKIEEAEFIPETAQLLPLLEEHLSNNA